ncbi:hypothetical protein NECAME_13042 [Necator americanus]|uniref:Ammonium transporter AmtB-like domain-containing protein n=1 Tax=Necator americanus TaxID=51031 RepID=W2T046_NECAM|nr:hypothetical protein NECAME_13042 [Necator americanus]ETN74332.1 hypothetical protein NECAME_13042 [Necator americanus]
MLHGDFLVTALDLIVFWKAVINNGHKLLPPSYPIQPYPSKTYSDSLEERVEALPAHWVWDSEGFFYKLGVVDFAGCSAVAAIVLFSYFTEE